MKATDSVRINERIRLSPILVIKEGENLGIIPTSQALQMAREAGLDLVEVSPNAKPPVCRIMDFGKYKYELALKAKNQKKSKSAQIKQMRLRPVTADHDLETKTRAILSWLEEGDMVQINMKFASREITHKELGFQVVNGILERVAEKGQAKSPPALQGKFLTCLIVPTPKR